MRRTWPNDSTSVTWGRLADSTYVSAELAGQPLSRLCLCWPIWIFVLIHVREGTDLKCASALSKPSAAGNTTIPLWVPGFEARVSVSLWLLSSPGYHFWPSLCWWPGCHSVAHIGKLCYSKDPAGQDPSSSALPTARAAVPVPNRVPRLEERGNSFSANCTRTPRGDSRAGWYLRQFGFPSLVFTSGIFLVCHLA